MQKAGRAGHGHPGPGMGQSERVAGFTEALRFGHGETPGTPFWAGSCWLVCTAQGSSRLQAQSCVRTGGPIVSGVTGAALGPSHRGVPTRRAGDGESGRGLNDPALGSVAVGAGLVITGGVGRAWGWGYLHLVLLKVKSGRQGLALLVRRVLVPPKELLQLLPLFRTVHRALLPLPPRGDCGQRGPWPKGKTGQTGPTVLRPPGPRELVGGSGLRAAGSAVHNSVASGPTALALTCQPWPCTCLGLSVHIFKMGLTTVLYYYYRAHCQ